MAYTTLDRLCAVFLYNFCFPWRRLCDCHAICCMDGKTIQCLPNPLQHVPIYVQYFPSYTMLKSMCKSTKIAIFTTFLPRDAMQARSMLSRSGCLSVRPSVTFVDHVKTNKDIFEIFSPSGSDTILVFPSQRGCRYSDGKPPNGVVECKGV